MQGYWRRIGLGVLIAVTSLASAGLVGAESLGSTHGADNLMHPTLRMGFTATYEAHALGSTLTATKTLTFAGDEGELRLHGRIRGLLRLIGRFEMERVSTFRIHDQGIQLLASRAWQISPNRERSHSLRLIEEDAEFIGDVNGNAVRVGIETGADIQDFLSVLYWSRMHLAGDADTLAGLAVTILERDRLRTYHMQTFPIEPISTPLGTFDTIRMVREDRERNTELSAWFAPALSHLPVRVDYDVDGRILSLKLAQIEWH